MQTDYYPIILIRGFDPSGGSVKDTFYGFNEGSVYYDTVNHSRIFEGFVVSFLKDPVHGYKDTTNVIRFHPVKNTAINDGCFTVSTPDVLSLLNFEPGTQDSRKTFWVFRYYDAFPGWITERMENDVVPYFAAELERYVDMVKKLTGAPKVNLICHSMGGIIARHLIQRRYCTRERAEENIHRIVSLGTPHGGIRAVAGPWQSLFVGLLGLLEPRSMDPREIAKKALCVDEATDDNRYGLNGKNIRDSWDPSKWLCVVGTRYADYQWYLPVIIRPFLGKTSDGLVHQEDAQLDGAPVAFLHKIHGGYDSLITSRESFEIATRFLFGTHRVKLFLKKGSEFGRFNKGAQYYLGTSIKPRGVDFFLSLVDRVSENCKTLYRPRVETNLLAISGTSATLKDDLLVYEGALDLKRVTHGRSEIMFRIDLTVYAEDDPLAGDKADKPSFIMWHDDHRPVNEQVIVAVNTNTGNLRWYQNSADAVIGGGKADKVVPGTSIREDDKLHLVYDDLPLIVDKNFNGTLRVEVTER